MPIIPMFKSGIPKVSGLSVPLPPKVVDPLYLTEQHQQWSKQVKQRARYTCERCGRTEKRMFADHIKEIRDGGTWSLANGQCLCGSCHTIKSMQERAKRVRGD